MLGSSVSGSAPVVKLMSDPPLAARVKVWFAAQLPAGPIHEAPSGPSETVMLTDAPEASVVDKDNRLVIALGDPIMEAWKVAPDASEREQVSELDQDTVGRSLFRSLMGIRRSLEPVTARPGLGGVSATTRANLEALGYVEPEVGSDESAP